VVQRGVFGVEHDGTDDVADGRSDLVHGHRGRFLGVTAGVGRDPRDGERVTGEQEGDEAASSGSDDRGSAIAARRERDELRAAPTH
jgi:hypothetical protein